MASSGDKPYVAVVASPGLGHIIPLLEFSKRLVTDHGCHVIFLEITTTAPSSPAQEQLLHDSATLPPELRVISLPPVHVPDIVPVDASVVTTISIIVEESLKKSLRAALNPPPKALVVDMFCAAGIDICKELSVPVYSFFTTTAALVAFSLYLPELDREVEGDFIDLPEPIHIPGCTPLLLENLIDTFKRRKNEDYNWGLVHAVRCRRASGIIINTWKDLEPISLSALRENPFFLQIPTPPIHTIGPLIKPVDNGGVDAVKFLSWLDNQPPESVLYICLGSGGSLTTEQLTELAWGLELSQQRFVWVVHPPSDLTASAYFFTAGSDGEVHPNTYLPKGFLERTGERGLVVPSWAPQSAILHHSSIRAFLSHCGWNSILESISCGVPMIAWPLYAEQRMNASMLEEVGVALWPEKSITVTVVKREVVMTAVKEVMEGEKGIRLKQKARELKQTAAMALTSGGKSMDTLTALCKNWK